MQYGILTFDEPTRDTSRKIIHIDMDAFFAAVEIREDPSLKGKPVIIARHPRETHGRGVVTTASYEARKFGVHSAMPAQKAYELCPQGIFIPGRHELYREVSEQTREIFKRYTDMLEPVSVDEAYLDVTEDKLNIKSATLIAQRIQKEVWQELHLSCSAGVSYNKFLAKLASDYQKPAGLTLITPDKAIPFLKSLDIEAFHGVGEKTVEKMHELDIHTGADLYEMNEYDLVQLFGKMGRSLYRKVRGIHNSPVNPTRSRKSVGKESTFRRPLRTEEEITSELRQLSKNVIASLKKHSKHGKTVVLKMRHEDYETKTRRKTFPNYIKDVDELLLIAQDIWEEEGSLEKGVRLLGVTVTGLDSRLYENIELDLWQRGETEH